MSNTYLKRENRVFGPYSLAQLKLAVSTGRLKPDDLVGPSEQGPWEAAAADFEVSSLFAAADSESAPFANANQGFASSAAGNPYQAAVSQKRKPGGNVKGNSASLVPVLWTTVGLLAAALLVVTGLLIFSSSGQAKSAMQVSAVSGPVSPESKSELAELKSKLQQTEKSLAETGQRLAQAEQQLANEAQKIQQAQSALIEERNARKQTEEQLNQSVAAADSQRQAAARAERQREDAARRVAQSERERPRQAPPSQQRPRESSGQGDPYAQAANHLEELGLQAQARGNTESMMEYQSAVGALSVLKSGDQQMLNVFSQSTIAKARLALRQFQSGSGAPQGTAPERVTGGGGSDAYAQAADYLDGLVLEARSRGDIEAMMEHEAAKGALGLLKSGNEQLLGNFSSSAVAQAKLALRRFQR